MNEIVNTTGSSTLAQIRDGSPPVLISHQGANASYSFIGFFTNSLANDNTREAYARVRKGKTFVLTPLTPSTLTTSATVAP